MILFMLHARGTRVLTPLKHSTCRSRRWLEEFRIFVEFKRARSTTAVRATQPVIESPILLDAPSAGPLAAYGRLVLEGNIREDENQVSALKVLQEVGRNWERKVL